MESPPPGNPFVAWLRRAQARHSYWLTRFLILRLLGFVYFAAFVSLAVQVLPLLGSNGLLPAQDWLPRSALCSAELGLWAVEGAVACK